MDVFTEWYIKAILWTEKDDNDAPLEDSKIASGWSEESLARINADCARFQSENATDIAGRDIEAGVDFWLTRNGHGDGFWDGDWPQPAGDRLTHAALAFGEASAYIGDDCLLYLS